jgi:Na+/proline symporter
MEELDLLKKDWKKKEHSFTQVSEESIYKMIHKESSSTVKWILILSILEVLLWSIVSIFYNSDEYLIKIHSEYLIKYFQVLTIVNYAVIALFIFLFYKNYVSISTTTSTKKLMKAILKTRKTVQNYVWYNLAMIAIGMVIGMVLAFNTNPEIQNMLQNDKVYYITIAFCIVALAIIFGLFWLFYRLVYGMLLRKLLTNYRELKKIDL